MRELEMWKEIEKLFSTYPAHIWLLTSGSTQAKIVGLHKKAFLASADAVNQHLKATQNDVWINALPIFHVGGLAIYARAYLSSSRLIPYLEKWCPQSFQKLLAESLGTLTALVPAQVYDLVFNNLYSPKNLRAVIVGGGAIEPSLYEKARKLGWPLLPSYGLTECASQVATAKLESLQQEEFPSLEILSHISLKISPEGNICLSSPALLSAYATLEQGKICLTTPITNDWFTTQDRGILTGNCLSVLGRTGDFIKIGGENVDFGHLEKIFEEIKLQLAIDFDIALGAIPDARLGHAVHLFTTKHNIFSIQEQFDAKVMPYERIRKVQIVDSIPRSPLGKILKSKLSQLAKVRD